MPSTLAEYKSRRNRLALTLTGIMLSVYFGFILLLAFAKEWMGSVLVPGLSWGILSGAGVISCAFALTGIYVRRANREEQRRSEFAREV